MEQYRKLAAIMFTDIVGYTALMQQSEKEAIQLREKHRSVFDNTMSFYGGEIINYFGDGTLSIFDSAVDAVKCAIELQTSFLNHPTIPVRIGIHMGDIMVTEDDVIGDAVNLASRFESMAVPGSVLVSKKVKEELDNHGSINIKYLGKHKFKNDKLQREVYAITDGAVVVPRFGELKGKTEKSTINQIKGLIADKQYFKLLTLREIQLFLLIIPIVIFSIIGYDAYHFQKSKNHARQILLPEIDRLFNEGDIESAFNIASDAEQYLHDDPIFRDYWNRVAAPFYVETNTPGVNIYQNNDLLDTSGWKYIGQTPMDSTAIFRDIAYWKFEKPGFQTRYFLANPSFIEVSDINENIMGDVSLERIVKMDSINPLYNKMVRVKGGNRFISAIPGIDQMNVNIEDFFIDKFEVTNEEFKEFINLGGYENPNYWLHPFMKNGKEIDHSEAIELFVDKSGQKGPSTWVGGNFNIGEENHPVGGVSWHEAAAYAEFKGKELPTLSHWNNSAFSPWDFMFIQNSNYLSKGSVEVGSLVSLGPYGTYDIAGNVREWCLNSSYSDFVKYTIGGGWNDPGYAFAFPASADAFDRSPSNGFRCILELNETDNPESIYQAIVPVVKKRREDQPVDDETFNYFLNQFKYDKKPINAKVEDLKNCKHDWICKRITIDAAYGEEELFINLFLPKTAKPPYQTIIYFPGSDVHLEPSSNPLSYRHFSEFDFFVDKGCAVAFPVYKTTFERSTGFYNDFQSESNTYKENVIMWVKDFSKTIDYLDTREDIDSTKLAFYGYSWGGILGGVIPAIEERIKLVILNVGGLDLGKALPEVDQINYVSRVKQPILLLNGKNDSWFPYEESQVELFKRLGTEEEHKKFISFEDSHFLPFENVIKESFDWLDKYFGPIEKRYEK